MTPTAAELDATARQLGAWMTGLGDRVFCAVADADGALVGAAWLVLFDRVPGPGAGESLTGDLQSVYVEPAHRNAGLGSGLVSVSLESVVDRPVGVITVQANARALAFYRRLGVSGSDLRLQR